MYPWQGLINSSKIFPLAIRLRFPSCLYCLVFSSALERIEYLKLYSSVSYISLELKKYAFFWYSHFGWCSVPRDMGVVLGPWQRDTFSAGGLSDVSLSKYCPQYLLADFPWAHVFTNLRLTQEQHQGNICKQMPGINVIMVSTGFHVCTSIKHASI